MKLLALTLLRLRLVLHIRKIQARPIIYLQNNFSANRNIGYYYICVLEGPQTDAHWHHLDALGHNISSYVTF